MAAVDGDWDVTIKSPMGDQKAVLTVNSDGGSFSGQMSGGLGSMDIANGTVDGDTLTMRTLCSVITYAVDEFRLTSTR